MKWLNILSARCRAERKHGVGLLGGGTHLFEGVASDAEDEAPDAHAAQGPSNLVAVLQSMGEDGMATESERWRHKEGG